MTMLQQKEAIKETEIIKQNQKEILELKISVTEMKNSLDELNNKFEQAGEIISKLSRFIEIMQS